MQPVMITRNKIKRARELRGWSQADVAEKLGCDARSVGRWERGAVSPSAYYRQKLCLLFDQNMEELGFLEESFKDDAQEPIPLEQIVLQELHEQHREENALIENTQEPPSENEMKTVQVAPYSKRYPQLQKSNYRIRSVSILQNMSSRMFIGLSLLLALVLGSIIAFSFAHPRNIPTTAISTTNIPYGKLLYTTTTPGSTCDLSGGQWGDYNQPTIQCLVTQSIISNSSATSPDLRGTLLTGVPNDTYPDNYVLEAQIQQPSTAADFGLYFRNQPGDQQGIYTFFIHPNGSWAMYVYDNVTAAPKQIAFGTTSVDPHSQLYLTVVATGPDFTFYVNRHKIGHVHDTTYSTGGVGIAVDAGGTIAVSKVSLYRAADEAAGL